VRLTGSPARLAGSCKAAGSMGLLAAAVLFIVASSSNYAQEQRLLSDEAALASLVRRAASESAALVDAPEVCVSLHPAGVHPMVLQIFTEELGRRGAVVGTHETSSCKRISIDVRELKISTSSLTDSSYFRSSVASIGVLGIDNPAGTVILSREFQLSRNDTINGAPRTVDTDFRHSGQPGFLDAVLAPLVAVAAAVVIVVLLFTVRGS